MTRYLNRAMSALTGNSERERQGLLESARDSQEAELQRLAEWPDDDDELLERD